MWILVVMNENFAFCEYSCNTYLKLAGSLNVPASKVICWNTVGKQIQKGCEYSWREFICKSKDGREKELHSTKEEFNNDTININARTFGKNNLCKTCNLCLQGMHIRKVSTSTQIFICTTRCRIGLLNSLQSQIPRLILTFKGGTEIAFLKRNHCIRN